MLDRRIYYTLLSSLTLSGFIVICTLGQTIYRQKAEAKGENPPHSLESVAFVVREYNGELGLFRGDSETPYKTIECDTRLFSEYDRSQLIEGIEFDSEAEVNIFLEDMIS